MPCASLPQGRVARAEQANKEDISTAHRPQAGAIEMASANKRRPAGENVAALDLGECAETGNNNKLAEQNFARVANIELPDNEILEAQQVRNAKSDNPSVMYRTSAG
jgi:hypothetical protein